MLSEISMEKDKYCRLSFSKLTTMELEKVNKNRSAIGFPTTEEWKILCKARKEKTVYEDLEGNIINVNDGNTWINICPKDAKVVIE